MPKDHRKPTDPRSERTVTPTPALVAAVSLLSASLGVSGTGPAQSSEQIRGDQTNSVNIKLAQANYSKVQMDYTTQSKQQLQSNQYKLERKAGKGPQEFLQSNQFKTQSPQSNQNKLERKPLVKGQHIPETSLRANQVQREPGKLEIPNRK